MKKYIISICIIILIMIFAVMLFIHYKDMGYQDNNKNVDNDMYNNWIGKYSISENNVTTIAEIKKVDKSFYLSIDIADVTTSNIHTKSSQGTITILNNTEALFDVENVINNINISSLSLVNDCLHVNLIDNNKIILPKLIISQNIHEFYQQVPFSFIDLTLNNIPLEYTDKLLSAFGNEINREYYSFEDETRAKIHYEKGVCLYVAFKENSNIIDYIVGYDVTEPSIIVARGLNCGKAYNDVISSFLDLRLRYYTNEKELPQSQDTEFIYGAEGYMNIRAYIEYSNEIANKIVYKNEESTIIFFLDNNMKVSKISYMR